MNKNVTKSALLCSALLLSVNAFADDVLNAKDTVKKETPETTIKSRDRYVGFSFGFAHSGFYDDFENGISSSSKVKIDDNASGAKIFVGRNINCCISVQMDFVYPGKFFYREKGSSYNLRGSVSITGLYGSVLFGIPFASRRGSVYLKTGLGIASVSEKAEGDVSALTVPFYSVYGEGFSTVGSLLLGIGLRFDINDYWGIRSEYEEYVIRKESLDGSKSNVATNMFSIGAYYRY